MKHEVTSYNTRKALSNSLKNAMSRKDLSKISISEVATAAKVNRKTFYYHFNDINELLFWTLEDGLGKITKTFDLAENYSKTIHLALDYVEKDREFMNKIIQSDARGAFWEFLCQNLREMSLKAIDDVLSRGKLKLKDDYKFFIADFSTDAIVGMLLRWVESPELYSRAKMEEYLNRVFSITIENLAHD